MNILSNTNNKIKSKLSHSADFVPDKLKIQNFKFFIQDELKIKLSQLSTSLHDINNMEEDYGISITSPSLNVSSKFLSQQKLTIGETDNKPFAICTSTNVMLNASQVSENSSLESSSISTWDSGFNYENCLQTNSGEDSADSLFETFIGKSSGNSHIQSNAGAGGHALINDAAYHKISLKQRNRRSPRTKKPPKHMATNILSEFDLPSMPEVSADFEQLEEKMIVTRQKENLSKLEKEGKFSCNKLVKPLESFNYFQEHLHSGALNTSPLEPTSPCVMHSEYSPPAPHKLKEKHHNQQASQVIEEMILSFKKRSKNFDVTVDNMSEGKAAYDFQQTYPRGTPTTEHGNNLKAPPCQSSPNQSKHFSFSSLFKFGRRKVSSPSRKSDDASSTTSNKLDVTPDDASSFTLDHVHAPPSLPPISNGQLIESHDSLRNLTSPTLVSQFGVPKPNHHNHSKDGSAKKFSPFKRLELFCSNRRSSNHLSKPDAVNVIGNLPDRSLEKHLTAKSVLKGRSAQRPRLEGINVTNCKSCGEYPFKLKGKQQQQLTPTLGMLKNYYGGSCDVVSMSMQGNNDNPLFQQNSSGGRHVKSTDYSSCLHLKSHGSDNVTPNESHVEEDRVENMPKTSFITRRKNFFSLNSPKTPVIDSYQLRKNKNISPAAATSPFDHVSVDNGMFMSSHAPEFKQCGSFHSSALFPNFRCSTKKPSTDYITQRKGEIFTPPTPSNTREPPNQGSLENGNLEEQKVFDLHHDCLVDSVGKECEARHFYYEHTLTNINDDGKVSTEIAHFKPTPALSPKSACGSYKPKNSSEIDKSDIQTANVKPTFNNRSPLELENHGRPQANNDSHDDIKKCSFNDLDEYIRNYGKDEADMFPNVINYSPRVANSKFNTVIDKPAAAGGDFDRYGSYKQPNENFNQHIFPANFDNSLINLSPDNQETLAQQDNYFNYAEGNAILDGEQLNFTNEVSLPVLSYNTNQGESLKLLETHLQDDESAEDNRLNSIVFLDYNEDSKVKVTTTEIGTDDNKLIQKSSENVDSERSQAAGNILYISSASAISPSEIKINGHLLDVLPADEDKFYKSMTSPEKTFSYVNYMSTNILTNIGELNNGIPFIQLNSSLKARPRSCFVNPQESITLRHQLSSKTPYSQPRRNSEFHKTSFTTTLKLTNTDCFASGLNVPCKDGINVLNGDVEHEQSKTVSNSESIALPGPGGLNKPPLPMRKGKVKDMVNTFQNLGKP